MVIDLGRDTVEECFHFVTFELSKFSYMLHPKSIQHCFALNFIIMLFYPETNPT